MPLRTDYGAVDTAMQQLKIETRLPEPVRHMVTLRANMERVLDEQNMTGTAFETEQRRLV